MEVGKGTVINKLLARNTEDYVRLSTYTTRPKRPNEKDGEQYFFVQDSTFQALDRAHLMMAKNKVDGYDYGAPIVDMDTPHLKDKYVVLDMGIKGAMEFKERYKNAIFVYLIPPTLDRLLNQMGASARYPDRINRSRAQIPLVGKVCNWLVINDNPDVAAAEIEKIMTIIKENAHDFGNLDDESLRFLYAHNLRSGRSRQFLEEFYGKEQEDMEQQL